MNIIIPELSLVHLAGPFDIVGDVHGCGDELLELLSRLGYMPRELSAFAHPQGRKVVFVGDLVDRGPRIADVLKLAMSMIEAGQALCVCGNHDHKLARRLARGAANVSRGLQESLDQL